MNQGTWGFTNDATCYLDILEYRRAAAEDGWDIRPTYKTEPVDRAATLSREEFTMQTISRDKRGEATGPRGWSYEASVHIWGPDGMSIRTPARYDWDKIREGLRVCLLCSKEDVATFRYSFAGRCCAECLPAAKKEYERSGWAD